MYVYASIGRAIGYMRVTVRYRFVSRLSRSLFPCWYR